MSRETAQDPILAFLRDQPIEVGDNLVLTCHKTSPLTFGQHVGEKPIHPILFQFPHPIVEPAIQSAVQEVLGGHQVFVPSEASRKVDHHQFPVIGDQQVAQIGIRVVDQLVEDPDLEHLIVPFGSVGGAIFFR